MTVDMLSYVKAALVEQARLVSPGETVQERLKREACDDFVADLLIYPHKNIPDLQLSTDRIIKLLEFIDEYISVKPYQVVSTKKAK